MPILKLFVVVLISTLVWPQKSFSGPLQENISVLINMTGDLTGQFDFSGPLNQMLSAESAVGGCEAHAMFRKVTSKGKPALEVWPTFNCIRDGQKKSYKLHRSYLDLSLEVQKISVKSLDDKIQSVSLEFRDLSLQKGK